VVEELFQQGLLVGTEVSKSRVFHVQLCSQATKGFGEPF
jgi:hypothetical protein